MINKTDCAKWDEKCIQIGKKNLHVPTAARGAANLCKKKDRRLLSVYDHKPICMECKKEEEKRTDYEDMSKQMIAACMETTNKPYGDPAGYCFHHFCPFKCKR